MSSVESGNDATEGGQTDAAYDTVIQHAERAEIDAENVAISSANDVEIHSERVQELTAQSAIVVGKVDHLTLAPAISLKEVGTVIEHAESASVDTEKAVVLAHEAEVHAEHANITAETVVTHIHLPSSPSLQDNKENPVAKEFLHAVKEQMIRKTEHDVTFICGRLQQTQEEISPTMTVVQTEVSSMGRTGDKEVGTDLYELDVSQIHADHEGRSVDHVMMLGNTGEGKTVMAKRYARLVDQDRNKPESMKHIELVHFVSVSSLHDRSKTTAFDLLFTCPIGSLSETLQQAGAGWVKRNANRILLILDGLDQSTQQFQGCDEEISTNTLADCNTILANVLSGHIYRGMKILSTTRWHTFYNLKKDQKARKTVALRGFKEDQIKKLLLSMVDEEIADAIFSEDEIQELLPMCKTPVLLFYILKVLERAPRDPHDTLSEIMVSVLIGFSSSEHTSNQESRSDLIKDISELAYHGMQNNHFNFSMRDIQTRKLELEQIAHLVTTNVKYDPFIAVPNRDDLDFQFSHQSLQEFLAAIYIANMPVNEFEKLIKGDLNESRWDEVCKLVYGMVGNAKTTKRAEKYHLLVDDEEQSIEKRKLVLDQLVNFLDVEVLSRIQTILLLRECCPADIPNYCSTISQISIEEALNKSAHNHIVASVISKCTQLQKVNLKTLELNNAVIRLFDEVPSFFKINELLISSQTDSTLCSKLAGLMCKFDVRRLWLQCGEELICGLCQLLPVESKVEVLDISNNKALSTEAFSNLTELMKRIGIECIMLRDCELTKEKLGAFSRNMDTRTNIQYFDIDKNKDAGAGVYLCIADIIKKGEVRQLSMVDCDITAAKLDSFLERIEGKHIQMDMIYLDGNKAMTEEAYMRVADIFKKADVRCLCLRDCDLTSNKLRAFSTQLDDGEAKIQKLQVAWNRTMTADAFRELPGILKKAGVEHLWMNDCNLKKEQLSALQESASEMSLKMDSLYFDENKSMKPDCYRLIPEILQHITIDRLCLRYCDLTFDKLHAFSENLPGRNIVINNLELNKNIMETRAFRELPVIIERAKVNNLFLNECDLQVDGLDEFQHHLQRKNHVLKMNAVLFDGNRKMVPGCYKHVANIFQNADIQRLSLRDCDLTSAKFQALSQQLDGKNISIPYLQMSRNQTMNSDACQELPEILAKAGVNDLFLDDCDLTEKKLHAFGSRLENGKVKIQKLSLCKNKTMERAAFEEVAQIIKRAKVEKIWMASCSLDEDKLGAFQTSLQERNIKVKEMDLSWSVCGPSENEVSILISLLQSVTDVINLEGWEFDKEQYERLQHSLDDLCPSDLQIRLGATTLSRTPPVVQMTENV